MYKKTNNPIAEEILKSHKERSCDLSRLKAIKIENNRFCCWCSEKQLFHGNQKYCSSECSYSATASFYPQKEEGLNYLLIKQGFKCAICLHDYAPIAQEICEAYNETYGSNIMDFRTKINWYLMKRLKRRCEKARKPEVDHIVPISKGGQVLGIDNHQAICYTCHKIKSSIDNSGSRKKK